MAIAATLRLSGQAYRVLHCDYEFNQRVDTDGRPSSIPDGGFINLVIESTRDETIIRWMLGYEMKNDGEIIFISRDSDAAMRRVEFGGAYCIYYKEIFDAEGQNPMRIHFRITCQDIKIDSTMLSKADIWGNPSGSSSGASSSGTSSHSPSSSGGSSVSSFNPND